MRGSTASRRVSEFVGVALFAASLIWVIALASYDPKDPAWFFSTAADAAPVNNFAGRIGAFVAELSFQLFGYASYFIPALLVTVGWNYFWCRSFDAAATKATGTTLLVALPQRAAQPASSARSRSPARCSGPAATRAIGSPGCSPSTSTAPAR